MGRSSSESSKNSEQDQPPGTFGPYRLLSLYGQDRTSLRDKVVAFWIGNKVLDEPRARQRADQLCVVAVDDAENPVGVTTVYIGPLHPAGRQGPEEPPYCIMRMFIQPQSRLPLLNISLLDVTYDVLNAHLPARLVAGLAFHPENRKLIRPGMVKLLARHGFHPIDKTPQGITGFKKAFTARIDKPSELNS